MAYTRLIRLYYRKEAPIPADIAQACRLIRASSTEERQAVETVLKEFFRLEKDGWHQDRCDREVASYQARVAHNRRVGKSGGRPRKSEEQKKPEQNPPGSQTKPEQNPPGYFWKPEQNPPQTPDTRHQTPEEDSVPIGTGAAAPMPSWDASEMTKDELWTAAKSLLCEAIPAKQCGSFVGKLIKDYGDAVVIAAVRAAVVARPADPVQYLKAVCMRSVGQRSPPNRQEAIEARNRSVAIDWLQQHGAQA